MARGLARQNRPPSALPAMPQMPRFKRISRRPFSDTSVCIDPRRSSSCAVPRRRDWHGDGRGVDHEVAHLYNPLHPAILYLLSTTIAAGAKAGIPVAVCGETAGDVKLTRLLLGLGLREFSMHPAQLLAVKQEILNADLGLIEPQAKKILRYYEPAAIAEAMERLRTL